MKKFFGASALLILLLQGCTQQGTDAVDLKVFALTPDSYNLKLVSIQGKVKATTPGGAGFLLEDNSGSVFVSTEETPSKIQCPLGSSLHVEGFLRKNSSIGETYFILTKVLRCSATSAHESAP
jgi:hypothetical protein